jgi:hypothetical protein
MAVPPATPSAATHTNFKATTTATDNGVLPTETPLTHTTASHRILQHPDTPRTEVSASPPQTQSYLNYGRNTYYTSTQIDQKDHLLSFGMLYKFRKNVYANINYNWWGTKFTDQPYSDYKYNRLILILSVKL